MNLELAKRLQQIEPSLTLAITAKAKELQAAGKDIISFGAGEPDFDTPEHIKTAAKEAMDAGQTRYTASGGSPAMKQAIITKLLRDNGLSYTQKEVMASNGGKHALYNLFMAVLNPGDEVLVPSPYWVSYPDQIKLAEAKPIKISCDLADNYLLRPDKLKEAITDRTRLLILNSPSNPTGATYTKEELLAIGKVLLEHPQIQIVSDDIYEHILYDGLRFYNLPMLMPELRDRCFLINGVSKAYSMTGWRIGFVAAPQQWIAAMEKIQGQCTSNPSSISQAAAIAALTASQNCVGEMRDAFAKRRDFVYDTLRTMPGVQVKRPQGAFYVFPALSEVYQSTGFQKLMLNTKDNSLSRVFCTHLLEYYEVAAVPGVAFGYDKAIRISYALGEEPLRKGLQRLGNMISDLGAKV